MKNIILAAGLAVSIGVAHAAAPRPKWYVLDANTNRCDLGSELGYPFNNPYEARLLARREPKYGGTKIYRHANGLIKMVAIETDNVYDMFFPDIGDCRSAAKWFNTHGNNLNDLK